MPGIFISYRRQEASGHAGRLYDALSQRFGEQQVFMDVGMEPGVDFVEKIKDTIRSCHVLVAVIGEHWTLVQDEHGGRRLEDPGDFIRLEIESALARPDLRVVPVLVQGAKMPEPEDLPPTLAALARRNAIELSDGRWRYDVERLLDTVQRILEPPAEPPAPAVTESARAKRATPGRRRGALAAAGALALAGVVALAVLVLGGGDDDGGPVAPRVALSAIPDGWPRELRLGLEEHPDAAKTVASQVGPELRYMSDAAVADVAERASSSQKAGAVPAFVLYRLSDLAMSAGGYPPGKDGAGTLKGLNDPAVMKLWFGEYVEFLRAARTVTKPVLLNLEPNLWGFAQIRPRQEKVPAAVPIGLGQLRDAPIRAGRDLTEFARAVVALRNKLARNVLLAWNLREWASDGGNLTAEDPGDDKIDALARKSARFYKAVGADFDLAFFDATDENGCCWTPATASNQLRYLQQFMRHSELRAVIARVPLKGGNWYLARDNVGDAVDAGVLGLMFRGRGDITDRADGRRYRAVAANYYDEPARLSR